MKRNNTLYTICFLLASMCINTACEDTLSESPDSSYERKDFFITDKQADMAVLGIYSVLPTIYGDKDGMAFPCSDDTYYASGTNSDNTRRDICHYTIRPANTWVDAVWVGKYQQINRANYTIAGIENMDGYSESEVLQAFVAEAKFLRAQAAFDLVRYWGDVPFSTNYTTDYEASYKPRTEREEIYEQIIKDLDFAKEHLKWANDSSSPERATQGSARALLMRVLLTRAGYSLQLDGKTTRPGETLRTRYFNSVISEWEAFQSEKGQYHGFYNGGYEELFKSFSAGILNNRESLFEVSFYYPGTKGYWGTYIGIFADAPANSADANKVMGRAAVSYRAIPEWYEFYEAQDTRRDVAIGRHSWTWNKETGMHEKTDLSKKKGNWTPAKWRREWMPAGYKDPNYTDVNYCMLRYADVVLMAAEAYNETGNTAKAWELLNSVRKRAGATEITARNYKSLFKSHELMKKLDFIDDNDDAGKFRTALYWERGFELAFEGQRKFDLIRWGILKEALTLFGENTAVNTSTNTAYPAYQNFKKGKHELFPIPEDELQINGKQEGVNNPGY